jgi:hypothetical protein
MYMRTARCSSKLGTQGEISVKTNVYTSLPSKATAQIGTNVRVRAFNVGLLAESQFAFERSVVFLGPRAKLGFAHLMPDCWLEVSLHPEGPWFSSVLEQS